MTTAKILRQRQVGATLLVAGCCIGAGMLGLPILSAEAGFWPSMVVLAISWAFMAATGLLLAEVNLWFDDEVSIISMAGRTIGRWGQVVSWAVYLFLFYSLIVAYVAGSGAFFVEVVDDGLGWSLPSWVGILFFAACFGVLIYLGTGAVDWVNRLFMVGLIVAYALLIAVGGGNVKGENLRHVDWHAATLVAPAMIVSFGYHNLVPSLTYYLHKDRHALRRVILWGSAMALVIYVLWEWLILGILPLTGAGGALQAKNAGEIATQGLRRVVGSGWVVTTAEIFSFCAIITSYLSVSLSFVDFLSDGLGLHKEGVNRVVLVLLVLVPPVGIALSYPGVFLQALTYAGGFGAVVLFGILPVLMAWGGREKRRTAPRLLRGGRWTLRLLLVFACAVFVLKLLQETHLIN